MKMYAMAREPQHGIPQSRAVYRARVLYPLFSTSCFAPSVQNQPTKRAMEETAKRQEHVGSEEVG